jgi:spatacsin
LHHLREIETKVWLLAVESEAQVKSEGEFNLTSSTRDSVKISSSIIDRTASMITKMDNHINTMKNRTLEKNDARENNMTHHKNQVLDASFPTTAGGSTKTKRRAKGYMPLRRPLIDPGDKNIDPDDGFGPLKFGNDLPLQEENIKMEMSFSRWEERVGPAELERAVLSLLEFGQITAAKQLQHKLSPAQVPSEFVLVDAALKLAATSTPSSEASISMLDEEVRSVIKSYNIPTDQHKVNALQVIDQISVFVSVSCFHSVISFFEILLCILFVY